MLKQTSNKWTLVFPLNFLLKPTKFFISMAFIKCSINHPTSSFSKPKVKTKPLLCSVIKHQLPPTSPFFYFLAELSLLTLDINLKNSIVFISIYTILPSINSFSIQLNISSITLIPFLFGFWNHDPINKF